MTIDTRFNRRRFVQATGAAVMATVLAGCSGDDGGGETTDDGETTGDGETTDDGETTGDGETTDDGETTGDGETTDDDGGDTDGSDGGSDGESEYLEAEPAYDGWFDDVDNYERTVDATGSDRVTVRVGAGSGLSFGPAAVAVSAGTTVVWEWTGEGGGHNVSAESGAFESETIEEAGHTFDHTFEEAGIHEYVCTPHQAVGMKGAVVVQ